MIGCFSGGSTLAPPTLPIAQYQVGDKMKQTIPPKSFWTSQFNQPESKFVKINLTVPEDGVFGIYGRRGAAPSIAQFDFFDIIDGRTLNSRVKRSTKVSFSKQKAKKLQTKWFCQCIIHKNVFVCFGFLRRFNTSLGQST